MGGFGQKGADPAQHRSSSFVLEFGFPPFTGVYALSAFHVHRGKPGHPLTGYLGSSGVWL